jgi:aerobic-type carbon monoxide dehydrogenase small subunit (CoxS/CutS family)
VYGPVQRAWMELNASQYGHSQARQIMQVMELLKNKPTGYR